MDQDPIPHKKKARKKRAVSSKPVWQQQLDRCGADQCCAHKTLLDLPPIQMWLMWVTLTSPHVYYSGHTAIEVGKLLETLRPLAEKAAKDLGMPWCDHQHHHQEPWEQDD